MMSKIPVLLIEDDKSIASFIITSLNGNGYLVTHATDGQEGLTLAASDFPRIILLDLGLPDIDGYDVIRSLRTWCSTPIIVISARTDEQDKVAALDLGADDYIAKPFGTDELMARIRTSLRHSHSATPERVYRADGLEIYFDKRQIFLNDTEIHLTQIEYQLLALLAESSGKVMTYKSIINMIWGPYADTDNQILRVNMANIRRKIELNPARPKYIFTEVGIGYRMLESNSLQSSSAGKAP